jgi:hypothetical protein
VAVTEVIPLLIVYRLLDRLFRCRIGWICDLHEAAEWR